jgi:predicted transcriptional regulator of viral defense system
MLKMIEKSKKQNEQEERMKALSKNEVTVIAWLEFYEKYFFTIGDIKQFFKNKRQRYNLIQRLLAKKRIIKLNREKYYLIPIKARTGKWVEDPFVLADEIFNGSNYFIGGWSAANYWRLTNQIPFWTEVYTTKRQGKREILNTKFIFRRTTKEKTKKVVISKMNKHTFRILNKRETKKWMKLRQYAL